MGGWRVLPPGKPSAIGRPILLLQLAVVELDLNLFSYCFIWIRLKQILSTHLKRCVAFTDAATDMVAEWLRVDRAVT